MPKQTRKSECNLHAAAGASGPSYGGPRTSGALVSRTISQARKLLCTTAPQFTMQFRRSSEEIQSFRLAFSYTARAH